MAINVIGNPPTHTLCNMSIGIISSAFGIGLWMTRTPGRVIKNVLFLGEKEEAEVLLAGGLFRGELLLARRPQQPWGCCRGFCRAGQWPAGHQGGPYSSQRKLRFTRYGIKEYQLSDDRASTAPRLLSRFLPSRPVTSRSPGGTLFIATKAPVP